MCRRSQLAEYRSVVFGWDSRSRNWDCHRWSFLAVLEFAQVRLNVSQSPAAFAKLLEVCSVAQDQQIISSLFRNWLYAFLSGTWQRLDACWLNELKYSLHYHGIGQLVNVAIFCSCFALVLARAVKSVVSCSFWTGPSVFDSRAGDLSDRKLYRAFAVMLAQVCVGERSADVAEELHVILPRTARLLCSASTLRHSTSVFCGSYFGKICCTRAAEGPGAFVY